MSVIALFGLVVAVLVWQSVPAMRTLGLRFLVQSHWNPVDDNFGALPFIYGTLATSALAMLIAVPLGVGTAAFMSEVAPPWMRRAGSFLVELLAAIPSVVYGTWGIFVLAPAVARFFLLIGGPETTGSGIFTAGLILAVMIVPYVAAVSYDVCQAVPRAQREASLALGATRWQTIWSVVLPYARSGIFGACFLALGRALGETMAVTMLIGNKAVIDFSLYAQGDTIASRIANQLNEADNDLWRSTLVELGLVLVLVTIVVNSLARFMIRRVGHVGRLTALLGLHLRRRSQPIPSISSALDSRPLATPARLAHCSMGKRRDDGRLGAVAPGDHRAALSDSELFGLRRAGLAQLGLFHPTAQAARRRGRRIGQRARRQRDACHDRNARRSSSRDSGGHFSGRVSAEPADSGGALRRGAPQRSSVHHHRHRRLCLASLAAGWFSGWAGSFALGVMMVPIVMRTSEESLKLVPSSLRNASYALGATQWQTVLQVLVPAALPAIITGVFLAIARIAGETAPLLLTAFGNQFWPRSPSDPTPSLPVYIYKYSTSAEPDWNRQAWAAALVLLTVVMLLSAGIRLLTGQARHSGQPRRVTARTAGGVSVRRTERSKPRATPWVHVHRWFSQPERLTQQARVGLSQPFRLENLCWL